MEIKNLLIDLGNVILDLDVDRTFNALKELMVPGADRKRIDKVLTEYECGNVSTDIFINTLLSQSKGNVQAYDIIEAWNAMLLSIPAHRLEMLSSLRKKFNVYLLSNTNELHLQSIHHHLRSIHQVDDFETRYFDKAYYSHLARNRKPDASFFHYIIDDQKINPVETLFMDDIAENIETAKTLGFHTYLVDPKEEIADYLRKESFY